MKLFAIDPGPKQSAFLKYGSETDIIYGFGIIENEKLLEIVRLIAPHEQIVCEMIQSFGMPVGKEIFETVLFIGQVKEASLNAGHSLNLIYRKEIKQHFCNTNRATDSNIRCVLIDRFGPPGTKKQQGKLYGIKKDIWSALALAVYFSDQQNSPH
jgi:hypothetical protein